VDIIVTCVVDISTAPSPKNELLLHAGRRPTADEYRWQERESGMVPGMQEGEVLM
jgi:hypothetical protein